MIDHSFAFYGLGFLGIILARYFVLAGATDLLLSVTFGQSTIDNSASTTGDRRKVLPAYRASLLGRLFGRETSPEIRRDITLSVLSSVVFALGTASILSAYDLGITRLYADIHQYSLWYLGVSYVIVIVLQDTYFYFLHRLFHHPSLFRWCHQGHHRSNHLTPWTSFAFDPPEAIAHLLFLVGISLVIPLHFITVVAVLSTMTVWAVVNHLGLDRLPANFPHHWCGRWFIGPAHHAIHHRQYRFHYGLYFTFWDRQFGTQAPYYDQEFDGVTHRNG